MPVQTIPCPACDVNLFDSAVERERHVESCVATLRGKYLELMRLSRAALENLEDDIENRAMRNSCGRLIGQLRAATR
jgi:hypothetical protein